MTEHANGAATDAHEQQPDKPLPVMVLQEISHWGVSPEGDEAVLVVKTISGQSLRVLMPVTVLADLNSTVRIASLVARKNQAEHKGGGEQLVAADTLDAFSVGHMDKQTGVLLVINPDKPDQHAYGMEATTALRLGQMLASEGAARAQVEKRLDAVVKRAVTPAQRRLILPGRLSRQ